MAYLTPEEFNRVITLLAEDLGLQRLRDRFVRYNALVTRKKVASPDKLADQLYMLTGGLRRQVAATVAVHSIWTEQINAKLGEEGEKELEELANAVNQCLGERDTIIADKQGELDEALKRYEERLVAAVGPDRARLDMILKAVPDVAVKLRGVPAA